MTKYTTVTRKVFLRASKDNMMVPYYYRVTARKKKTKKTKK